MNTEQSTSKSAAVVGKAFEVEVREVLPELRAALAGVLEHLNPPVSRATDLRQRLGLDQSLSWNIYNAATASESLTIAPNLPGLRPMQRFLEAASACGVPQETIQSVRLAFDRYEALITRHARSRDAFETMVAELAGARDEATAKAELKHKKSMFQSASLLWGRQARTLFNMLIVGPGKRPEMLDGVVVNGMIGLHRTRRSVPLQSFAGYWTYPPGASGPQTPSNTDTLDPRECEPGSIGLLRDFCSQPLPRFDTQYDEDGRAVHKLVSDGLGITSEVSYFTGHVLPEFGPVFTKDPDGGVDFKRFVRTPAEASITDMLMHESVWDETPPELQVFAWPLSDSIHVYKDSDLLPVQERAVLLGRGPNAGRTPLVPRYTEMVRYAMDRVGWNPQEFRVFRGHVDYPMLHTRIRMVFKL